MRPRRMLAPRDALALFQAAVGEKALAVVTVQQDPEWSTFKCRFLESNANQRFLVLDYHANGGPPPPPLAPGQYVGINFRHHSRKVLFATVVEAKGRFLLDDRTSVPAVRYRWPDNLIELQRRAYYRTPVPESLRLVASVWPGGQTAREQAQGGPLQIVSGELVDVSCGGALIHINQMGGPGWSEGQTLGMELQLGDGQPPVMLNGHYRGTRPDATGNLCIAVQFVGMEVTVDGRLVLQRLAHCVQKFHHMSAPSGLPNSNARNRQRPA